MAGAQLWLEIRQGQLERLDGELDVPKLDLKFQRGAIDSLAVAGRAALLSVVANDSRIRLRGRRDEHDFHLWYDADVNWQQDDLPNVPSGRLSRFSDIAGGAWQLALKEVDVTKTANWLVEAELLPPNVTQYLAQLKPQGRAQQVRLNLLPEQDWQLGLVAELDRVSTQSWQGIPALSTGRARLELSKRRGRVVVEQQSLQLDFPDLYRAPWLLQGVSGEVYWQLEHDYARIMSPGLTSRYQAGKLSAGFALYLPQHESDTRLGLEPQLHLQLGFDNMDVLSHKTFVPGLLIPDISRWLDEHIKAGHVKQGSFLFAGSIAQQPVDNSNSVQLYLDVQEDQVQYLQDWPELSDIRARVLLDSPNLDIWINKASTQGGHLVTDSGRLKIRQQDAQSWLTVTGQLKGDAAGSLKYLQQGPLQQLTQGAFDDWHAQGPVLSDIFLRLSLDENAGDSPPDIRLNTYLSAVNVELSDLRLNFYEVTGELSYNSKTGLNAERLALNTFDGPVEAKIRSQRIGTDFDINIEAKGQADSQALQRWSDLFLLQPVSGRLGYQLEAWLRPESRGGLRLTIDSDLKGVVVDTPAPFGKSADSTLDFSFSLQKAQELRLEFKYDRWANGAMALVDGALERGQIHLGQSLAYLPSDEGLKINGHLPLTLDAQAWWELWQVIRPAGSAGQLRQPFRQPFR